jgi:Fic family protein
VVTIIRRTVKGSTYYYLEHAVRQQGRVTKKSKYLGRAIPKNIDTIRKEFEYEINKEKWFKSFDKIKLNYTRELNRVPRTAIEKSLKEFSVRFTYDTQRIEGSTLSLRETAQLLEAGTSPSGKPLSDVKEAEAHQRVFFEMLRCEKDLSIGLTLYWHKKLFEVTKPDIAGQIRKHGVRIMGSRFIPPSPVELQRLIREFFGWYDISKSKTHPVELAALVHLKFVTIHPFTDGNGRVSRLMINFVLNRRGYPMLNIEYKSRRGYYNSLERSQLRDDASPFCQWLFRKYLEQTKSYA